jgi:hypothetical protein
VEREGGGERGREGKGGGRKRGKRKEKGGEQGGNGKGKEGGGKGLSSGRREEEGSKRETWWLAEGPSLPPPSQCNGETRSSHPRGRGKEGERERGERVEQGGKGEGK